MGNSTSRKTNNRHSAATRELEKLSVPTGLYSSCPWGLKTARRLIVERKLAPRYLGKDVKEGEFKLECPICFMFYPGSLNMSTCCNKPICSECYLQIRPPQKSILCPFCNQEAFTILYKPPSPSELMTIQSWKNTKSPRRSSAICIPKQMEALSTASSLRSIQYASVEDRHRIRDSLRLQLSISDKPVKNSPHPNSVAALNEAASHMETSADATRLEELMLLEAIRRSMQDLHVDKNDDEVRISQSIQQLTHGGGKMGENDDSDSDYTKTAQLSASRSTESASGVAHSSSNSLESNSCYCDIPLRSSDIPS